MFFKFTFLVVKYVFLLKIEVAGNLGNQKRSDNILKQSVRSMRSVAAQRVLKMARFVLKSGATIAQ